MAKRRCLKIMVLYMYIAPEQGQTTPLGQIICKNINLLSVWSFCCKFFPLKTLSQSSPLKCTDDQIVLAVKIGQRQPRVIIYINIVELESLMLHAKFQYHRTSGSGTEDFEGFYHTWAWRPSWSCDLKYLHKLWFPLHIYLALICEDL